MVNTVAFSPVGEYTVSGGSDNTLRLWDIEIGNNVRTFLGHTDGVAAVAFSPNGKYILSGALDSTVRLWEVSTGKEIRKLKGHTEGLFTGDMMAGVYSVKFTPDGKSPYLQEMYL